MALEHYFQNDKVAMWTHIQMQAHTSQAAMNSSIENDLEILKLDDLSYNMANAVRTRLSELKVWQTYLQEAGQQLDALRLRAQS